MPTVTAWRKATAPPATGGKKPQETAKKPACYSTPCRPSPTRNTPTPPFTKNGSLPPPHDADAQYKLAALYLTGVGVSRDRNEALNWLEKASAQNHAAAQYQLGRLYDSFNSSFRNPVKALEWWEKASALGNADAQNALALKYAISYLIDDGYPQDPCRAIALREQAAAQGHPQAQTSLAANYIDGEPACNLAADKTKARALLEQVIANGSKRTREQAKLILYELERDTQ